mmetsp:Transcript_13667/g.29977  ORF Transcript_13667/g.29977 Transcript_13667/m.29977 type:complete len:327 (+) Transcript_13667:92-1072(+)
MTTNSQPASGAGDLATLAETTILRLKENDPKTIDGVSTVTDHPLPPFIPKRHWMELGDAVRQAERLSCDAIPGEFWVSLRCDGTGFSKMTKHWKKRGLLQPSHGYSPDFATIMTSCCEALMKKFNAKVGYTQSDELTVLLAPASVVRGEQQGHLYSGRVQKLASLAAGTVTAHFNNELRKFAATQRAMDEQGSVGDLLAVFDCRVGMFQTREEAFSLILWRAYDCGVNGVSDAVHHCRGHIEGAKETVLLPLEGKLKWLNKHGRLPLESHQRDGTYLIRRRVAVEAVNPTNGEEVVVLRSRIQPIEGNVLTMCKNDLLYPEDDEQP